MARAKRTIFAPPYCAALNRPRPDSHDHHCSEGGSHDLIRAHSTGQTPTCTISLPVSVTERIARMKLIPFHDDDVGYADWTRRHRHNAYVLTKTGSLWSLHRATCLHIADTGDGASRARAQKVCGVERRLLELYAVWSSRKPAIQPCEECVS